jgi:hypothetical protein
MTELVAQRLKTGTPNKIQTAAKIKGHKRW